MPTPFELGSQLDFIILGADRSPGTCKLSGHRRTLNWDIKAAKGQTGASSTLNGQPLGEFEAEFYLADDGSDPGNPTDFDLWEDFARLIWSTVNGPKPVALPIYHPDLARNLYTEVVLRDMGEMIHDGRGGATIKVKFGEHRPPKPKPPAKAATKPGAATSTKPDPNAAAKRELASLIDEAQRP